MMIMITITIIIIRSNNNAIKKLFARINISFIPTFLIHQVIIIIISLWHGRDQEFQIFNARPQSDTNYRGFKSSRTTQHGTKTTTEILLVHGDESYLMYKLREA